MANRKVENWLSKLFKSPIIYRSKDHNKRVKVDGRYVTPKPYFVLFKNGDIVEVTPKTSYKFLFIFYMSVKNMLYNVYIGR